ARATPREQQRRDATARRRLARQNPVLYREIYDPAMRPELAREQQPAATPNRQPAGTRRRSRRAGGRILNVVGGDLGSSQAAQEAWLDEHDARVPLTRAHLHSHNDDAAARAVAAGGGMQAVNEPDTSDCPGTHALIP